MWGAIFEFGVIDAKKASTQGTPASLRSFAVFGNRLQFVGSQVVRSMSTSVRQSGPYDAAESLSAAATQTLFPFFFRLSASSMATARNSSRTTSQFASSSCAHAVVVRSQNGIGVRPGRYDRASCFMYSWPSISASLCT